MKNWIFLLLVVFSCQAPMEKEVKKTHQFPELNPDRYKVAFLIMDGVFNTELTAPYDIFQHTKFRKNIKSMDVFTVAKSHEPVKTFEGLKLIPDYSYVEDSLPKIDILVVPSAEHHLDTDLEDTAMIDFVKTTAENALYVTSHCDGAFVLATSGILQDIESTTFPGDIDKYKERFPTLKIHKDVMFVHDGKFITSAGGARSFDAALYLAELLYGKEIADRLAQGLVIDWNLKEIPHIIVK